MRALACFALLLAIQCCAAQIKSNENDFNWKDIKWVNQLTALLLNLDGSVYRSIDGGQTWLQINSKLEGSVPTGSSKPQYMYVSDTIDGKIYIRSAGATSWVSSDFGSTWAARNLPALLAGLDWHPNQGDYVMARDAASSLWASTDFGITWMKVHSNVFSYAWGDAGLGDVPKTRVYFVVQAPGQLYYDFLATDDWGISNITIQSRGVDFEFHEKTVFAATWDGLGSSIDLKVSEDIGHNHKEFLNGVLPTDTKLENRGFAILDDHTGAVFMGVIHEGSFASSDYGNLYVSDATGSRYSYSLKNVHQEFGRFDFERVHGLEGIYFANQMVDVDDDNAGVRSFISYNTGGTWGPIKAPHYDSLNQSTQCTGSCSLHLHLGSSEFNSFGSVYASHSAVGILLANGNIGNELSYSTDLVNTYISRDAGVTWFELRKGPSAYIMGDHGGILILVPSDATTTTLFYSLDFGNTLTSYHFTDLPVQVAFIRGEPDSVQERFVLMGNRVTAAGAVIGLDFSGAFSRPCKFSDDYEAFTPAGPAAQSCLLGRNVTYWRRKASSICYDNEATEIVANTVNCTCTEDDWECDVEFERNDEDGTCMYIYGANDMEYPPEHCPAGETYYKTKGYRKEAGNTCQGGVDHSPEGPFDCPSVASSGKKGWVAAAVLIPLLVLIIIGGLIAIRSDTVREKLPFLKFLATWKVGYFNVNGGGSSGSTSLLDEEDENEREDREFSIQAEEIEEGQLERLEKSEPKRVQQKQDALISMDDVIENSDFNPRS